MHSAPSTVQKGRIFLFCPVTLMYEYSDQYKYISDFIVALLRTARVVGPQFVLRGVVVTAEIINTYRTYTVMDADYLSF